MGELFNVVDQAIELPLALNLILASQAEAVESFVGADIAEDWFNHGHPVAVNLLALGTIHTVFHPIGIAGWPFVMKREADLSARSISVVG